MNKIKISGRKESDTRSARFFFRAPVDDSSPFQNKHRNAIRYFRGETFYSKYVIGVVLLK
jgi:hypothetical protein